MWADEAAGTVAQASIDDFQRASAEEDWGGVRGGLSEDPVIRDHRKRRLFDGHRRDELVESWQVEYELADDGFAD